MPTRRTLLAGGAALTALAACQTASQNALGAAAMTPRYSARAFFETTTHMLARPDGKAFSPDGRFVLLTSDKTGVFNAYALPAGGGEPIALTASTTNATFAVSYFPNDARVIVTADTGGDELNHVFVRELDGSLRDLTPGENLKADFAGWRGDGAKFWIVSNERNPQLFDLYEYDAASYERRLVFENPGLMPSAVSRDGRWLALDRPVTSADSDILLVDLQSADKTPRNITEHTGAISHSSYDFTPDSGKLIYATDEHGEFSQAWSYDVASGAKAALIAADWDVMFVTFSPSGRYRVSALNADASTDLTILDTRSGREVALRGAPDGDLGQVRFNADETKIVFTVASDTSPADVFIADLATGAARRLTHALNPEIDEGALVTASIARYPSFDGLQIPGVLYRPRDASAANKAPAIVWVHGGPGGQSRRGYGATIQHLVNHGYCVYAVNNRGSSGYGKTFFHLDDRKHGEVDLDDVVYAKRLLQTLDWVDGGKIGILGGSYGGYMVAAALAFRPQEFAVGVDIFGVTNWVRTLTSIPPWWQAQRAALYDEMGDPAVDGERHRRISPLFHASNIVKPLQVIQGANDPRVLQVESDELVAAVRANNVPVDYIIFPDEGHGFLKRENRVTASEAHLRFLDQYLRG